MACVVPVFLFGCESWILTDTMLHQLESFKGEIRCHILNQATYHLYPLLSWLSDGLQLPQESSYVNSAFYQKRVKREATLGLTHDSLRITQKCRGMKGKLARDGSTDAL